MSALPSLMRKVIVSTIEHRMIFGVVDGIGAIVATTDYTKFAKMTATLVGRDENVSFITFIAERLLGQSALAVIGPSRPMTFDDAITAIAGEVFDIGI
jgi:hypothetical protein